MEKNDLLGPRCTLRKILPAGETKLWWCRRPKGEMGYHGIKITIIMKQDESFQNTERCDNDVDGFSHRNARFSKTPVMLSTLNGDMVTADLAKWESAEEILGCFIILIRSETLKNLGQDKVPNGDGNT